MNRGNNSLIGKLGGPVGSVLLHVLLFFFLLKVLVFEAPDKSVKIDVQVVEQQQKELEEIDRKLEKLEKVKTEAEALAPPDEQMEEMPDDDWKEDSVLDSEVDLSGLDASSNIDSPLMMKGLLAGRSDAGRQSLLREFAGAYAAQAEAAVVNGLNWLQTVQEKDGSWGTGTSKSMTAKQERARLTGLALLSFLAHGETPQSDKYGETVQRAIQYLLGEQDPKTGVFCPFSKTVGSHDDIGVYGHAIATYALAEAYGLTRAPVLKRPVEKAAAVIVKGQQENGGWDHRYQHEKWSDLSVAGWQVQALKAAAVANIQVEGLVAAMEKAPPFIQSMHKAGGEFYYRIGNEKPSEGLDYMTGAAVLCLQLLGQANQQEVKDGLGYLHSIQCSEWEEGWQKTKKNRSFNIAYEWYYNTQAIFQKGGSKWTSWNNKFAPMLINAQSEDGAWKPPSESEEKVSKDIIYTTSFCTLSLQVYYRILPTFKKVEATPEPQGFDDDVTIEIM
ncbi:MAG: terpene cyclase/mutase family protein [Kiritimatiellales bacterium]|nr:terpene cyclase/mutase family protein [Kiritimatiellales bacterium]